MQTNGADSFISTVEFNHDHSYFTLSTTGMFASYSACPVRRIVSEELLGGMKIVMQLHRSPLLVLVPSGDKPGGSPRRLSFWDCRSKAIVRELAFETAVTSCAMNKEFLAVGTENIISLFSLTSLALVKKIATSTASAVFSLSAEPASLLAYTSHRPANNSSIPDASGRAADGLSEGTVSILDCNEARLVSEIPAHKSAVSNICFSPQADRMATASVTGSVIRVFLVPTGECTHFLRHRVPAPLHLFSYFNLTTTSSTTAGASASQQTAGKKVTALSFCPKGHYVLGVSANEKDGGFLNVYQVVEGRQVAMTVGPRFGVDDDANPSNDPAHLKMESASAVMATETHASADANEFYHIEADDLPEEDTLGTQAAGAESTTSFGDVRYTLGAWQQQFKRAASKQLQSLQAMSQEYINAAAAPVGGMGVTSVSDSVRASAVGTPPVMYARVHGSESPSLLIPAAVPITHNRSVVGSGSNAAAHHEDGEQRGGAYQHHHHHQQQPFQSAASMGRGASEGSANFFAVLNYVPEQPAGVDSGDPQQQAHLALTVVTAAGGVLRR